MSKKGTCCWFGGLQVFDNLFCAFFTAELLIRLLAERICSKGYVSSMLDVLSHVHLCSLVVF